MAASNESIQWLASGPAWVKPVVHAGRILGRCDRMIAKRGIAPRPCRYASRPGIIATRRARESRARACRGTHWGCLKRVAATASRAILHRDFTMDSKHRRRFDRSFNSQSSSDVNLKPVPLERLAARSR